MFLSMKVYGVKLGMKKCDRHGRKTEIKRVKTRVDQFGCFKNIKGQFLVYTEEYSQVGNFRDQFGCPWPLESKRFIYNMAMIHRYSNKLIVCLPHCQLLIFAKTVFFTVDRFFERVNIAR
jgi:hypothetical protein